MSESSNLNINKLLHSAGDNGKYQYIILTLAFLFWVCLEILAISLPYLEKTRTISIYDQNKLQYRNISLNYTICEKDIKKTYLNKTIEKSGHSWVIEFDIECNQVITGLIGSFTFLGVLLGSILFQTLPDTIGRKNSVIIGSVMFSIILFLFNFINDYISAFILSFLLQTFGCLSCLTIFMMATEITATEKRSLFGAIINSAFSFSGVFFIIVYKKYDDWRINFNLAALITIIVTFLFYKYAIESPRFYLTHDDKDNLINSLNYIAKCNNRENELKKELESQQENNINLINKSETKSEKNIENEVDKISTNSEEESVELNQANHFNENTIPPLDLEYCKNKNHGKKYNTINFQPTKNHQPQTFSSLIIYPQIRQTFLINCYIWFSTSGIYYGLSIYLKNLPGDLYYNGIFIYISEVFSYILSAWIINVPKIGRKGSMIIFEFISLLGYIILIFFNLDDYNKTLLSFVARFSISGVYNIIYTYSTEVYPTVVRAKGFGFNSICARLGGILFPLLIELLDNQVIIVFTLLNLIALLLIFLLPETYGKPLEDYIK